MAAVADNASLIGLVFGLRFLWQSGEGEQSGQS